MDREGVEAIRDVIHRLHESEGLPEVLALEGILEAARSALSSENPSLRPRDVLGRPGGLILLNPGLTTILVPDLHARTGYMAALVDMETGSGTVLERLAEGSLQILCVGDGFHSEARGAERWKRAWDEFQGGFRRHESMDSEMRESLSLMAMVMILKSSYPDRFHFLKGNHENIANSEDAGNRPFGKYAWEGQMVKDWFLRFLGEDLLNRWADFESSLPLLAIGDRFMVSHAEPRRAYTRDRIISYRDDDSLIFDFTWTGNGEAEEGSVDAMLEIYLGTDAPGSLYFGGHRPVRSLYGVRASGRYVQIHNPDVYVVAQFEPGRFPDPLRDIRSIDGRKQGYTHE